MSKVGTLTAFIKGLHVMGDRYAGAGLRDYYAAKAVIDAGRKRNLDERFNAVRAALKNHRVTVTRWPAGSHGISIQRTTNGDGETLACPQSWNM